LSSEHNNINTTPTQCGGSSVGDHYRAIPLHHDGEQKVAIYNENNCDEWVEATECYDLEDKR